MVEEDKAPLASSTIQRAEVFLPEVFGQFWINWFGGGYEKFETNQAELVVKDGAGNIIDQASAVGSGSSAWVSLKPTLPYYIVSKIELRAELQRERMIKIESPLEFALTEKSVIQTTIQDTAPRYMVGYQSRLATFAFLQVTGVLPLQPEVTVTQVRANGQTEVQKAKLNEVNIDARISLHFTVTEAPHQFSFDTYIGGKYDQKAYVIKGVTQTQTIVTPYDLQPYVLFGLTYVK